MILFVSHVRPGQKFTHGGATFQQLPDGQSKCIDAAGTCYKQDEVLQFGQSVNCQLLGCSWRAGTIAEYNSATCVPYAEKKKPSVGGRVTTVAWFYCGHKIAEKVEEYARTNDKKPQRVSYYVDPAFVNLHPAAV